MQSSALSMVSNASILYNGKNITLVTEGNIANGHLSFEQMSPVMLPSWPFYRQFWFSGVSIERVHFSITASLTYTVTWRSLWQASGEKNQPAALPLTIKPECARQRCLSAS